jgi:hypothetical protein
MNFVYLRSSRLNLVSLDSCIGKKGGNFGGEKLHCIPITYRKSQGGPCAFLLHFWLFGGVVCSTKSVWPILVTDLTGFGGTGLTRFGNRPDRFVFSVGTCSEGVCICAGGALVCFGGLCSLLEHSFVSDVSSCCPCLRGPRLVLFKWSCSLPFPGFRSLVGVSFGHFFSFSFSLWLPNVCVVNVLIKGEIEDHVCFEDRWMVTSWCDEWLTTLWGHILG